MFADLQTSHANDAYEAHTGKSAPLPPFSQPLLEVAEKPAVKFEVPAGAIYNVGGPGAALEFLSALEAPPAVQGAEAGAGNS
ncbi:hypothetical protein CHLRE_14g621676v5 [Chlamydomonas reinhardtii]|uniref:Uncharacterized protein n=1 Tax=Chlamydomonas reinhardtii TaxID=3055 RepID=A0A2K3CY10_CHLRE|nr:uncharacterized protein CHLRE_14g621676v5 [Chlamydomonas reinhardtii]PNW73174.1 hypothetical protein CHLRE_14g621676v5 [Chlamydomonas reinhardtii]